MGIINYLKWYFFESKIQERIEMEKQLKEVDEYIANLYRQAEEIRNTPIPPCS